MILVCACLSVCQGARLVHTILVSVYMFVCQGAMLVHMILVCACLSVCLSRFVNTVSLHPDGNCIGGGTTDSVVKVYTCVMVMNNTNVQLCLECCGCLQNVVWLCESITQQVWDVRMNT